MFEGPFRTANVFLLASAILHIFAFLVGGFSGEALGLIVPGLVYLAVAYGLSRGLRWLAYLAFFGVAIGAMIAIAQIWAPGPVPGWWYILIVVADFLCVAALFAALWRSPERAV